MASTTDTPVVTETTTTEEPKLTKRQIKAAERAAVKAAEAAVAAEAEKVAAEKAAAKAEAAESKRREKLATHAIEGDTLQWIADNARPAVTPCLCGCGETTKGRFFPGHDALLKRTLTATIETGDEAAVTLATQAMATFGW